MRARHTLDQVRASLGAPALVTAVVDAQTTRTEVAGAIRRGGEPATVDDAWHLGSCTKSLTAALLGLLVQEGLVDWDTPLAELLPDLAGAIDPGWTRHSLELLLWCRAGVAPDLPLASRSRWWADPRPLLEQRTAAALAALRPAPRRPGRFVYSNLSYVVAGAVIDRLVGGYEDALRARLLDPLGVTSAGFGAPPRVLGHRPRLRLGPLLLGAGRPVDPADGPADNPAVLAPAGTLHLTIGDWARVQRMFQADAPGPLLPSTIARLLRMPDHLPGHGIAMGWGQVGGPRPGAMGMQGSNTLWSATALLDADRRRTALVVANDGRSRVLQGTAVLALDLLDEAAGS